MTSWKRGHKNEAKGDRMLESDRPTEKAKGAALKATGMVEQGIDNVKDKITGEQKDLKGEKPTRKRSASTSAHSHPHSESHGETHSRSASSPGSRTHNK